MMNSEARKRHEAFLSAATLGEDGLFKDDPGAISTYTGRKVNPLTMTPADVCIEDVAHALAYQCRYNGHCRGFLSVARHSLWVADLVPEHLERTALLHDAAEAYLGDLVRPLKHSMFGEAYLSAEAHVERQVALHFGLTWPWPREVGEADNEVLHEVELVAGRGARFRWHGDPEQDEQAFLARYRESQAPSAGPMLIGLAGYARTGKDTVGRYLCEEHDFIRVAFADALRDLALGVDPIIGAYADDTPMRLGEVVSVHGWEAAKDGWPEIRRLLQRLGTEGGRAVLGDDVWVNAAMAQVNGRTVFTDVRFPNEAEAIMNAGGQVWEIVRPGVGPVSDHPSETALDGFPFSLTILNNGTYDDLRWSVNEAVGLVTR